MSREGSSPTLFLSSLVTLLQLKLKCLLLPYSNIPQKLFPLRFSNQHAEQKSPHHLGLFLSYYHPLRVLQYWTKSELRTFCQVVRPVLFSCTPFEFSPFYCSQKRNGFISYLCVFT